MPVVLYLECAYTYVGALAALAVAARLGAAHAHAAYTSALSDLS